MASNLFSKTTEILSLFLSLALMKIFRDARKFMLDNRYETVFKYGITVA